jgi:hypothetical protein
MDEGTKVALDAPFILHVAALPRYEPISFSGPIPFSDAALREAFYMKSPT